MPGRCPSSIVVSADACADMVAAVVVSPTPVHQSVNPVVFDTLNRRSTTASALNVPAIVHVSSALPTLLRVSVIESPVDDNDASRDSLNVVSLMLKNMRSVPNVESAEENGD